MLKSVFLSLFVLFFVVCSVYAEDGSELKKIIMQQQQQIAMQQKQIAEQGSAIKQLQETVRNFTVSADGVVENTGSRGFVISQKNNVNVKLYGSINRAVVMVDDGKQDDIKHVDPDICASRFGIEATSQYSDDLLAGAKIECEYQSNPSNVMSMSVDTNNPGFNDRHLDFYLKSKKYGSFYLGQGSTSTDGTAEVDYSNSWLGGLYSYPVDMNAGFTFYNKTAGDYTTTTGSPVSFFDNMDGLGRQDRFRYDSPTFAGFMLSSSTTAEDGYDIALHYEKEFADFKANTAVGYADPGNDPCKQISGSVSVLHVPSGLSFVSALGYKDYENYSNNEPNYCYFKLAYDKSIFSFGDTAFGLDFGQYNDMTHAVNISDIGRAYGFGVVQQVDKIHTDLYATYRLLTLDREGSGIASGTDYEDMHSFWAGARYSF